MAFGCKVEHCARLVLRQQVAHQARVAYVALDKNVARVTGQRCQVVHVARVGQLVQVHHGFVRASEPVQNEVATNKSGAAGHKDGHLEGVFLKSACNKSTWQAADYPWHCDLASALLSLQCSKLPSKSG